MSKPYRLSRPLPCDLCGDAQFEQIATLDRHGKPLSTVMCRRCGLISHEQIPTDDELAAYYAYDYRRNYHGQLTPAPHRVLRAWEGGKWLLDRLLPHVPTGSRICEIGAGMGCTVKQFELAGFSAEGIEPGHGFHAFACEQLKARIKRASLFDLPDRLKYDFVMLVHVIEHFNSPSRALRRIRSLLSPSGRLYVECPNIAAPHAAPNRQFHFAHIHNFTPETLRWLAETTGFRVCESLAQVSEPNLRLLLECAEEPLPAPQFPGHAQALRQWRSQSSWRYYTRLTYLRQRLVRDLKFASQHFAARQRVGRILEVASGS